MSQDELLLVAFLVVGSMLIVGIIAIMWAIALWLVRTDIAPADQHNCYNDEWYHSALTVGQVYQKFHSEKLTRCDGTAYWLVWIHWEDPNACMGWDDLIGFDFDPPERFVMSSDYEVRGIAKVMPPPLPKPSEGITCQIPSSTD